MVCFHVGECSYPSLTACLQQNLYLAHKEISLLKERRNLKHTKVSLKWRDTAFYYKKRVKGIEMWAKEKGIKLPTVVETFSMKEEIDEGIRNSHSASGGSSRGDIRGDKKGTISNQPGGQTLQ